MNIATGTEVNGDAYNILYNNEGNKIDNLYFLSNSRMERPEQHLLGILKQVYGRVIEKLNITVEQSYLNPMMRLVRNGKEYRILSEKIVVHHILLFRHPLLLCKSRNMPLS